MYLGTRYIGTTLPKVLKVPTEYLPTLKVNSSDGLTPLRGAGDQYLFVREAKISPIQGACVCYMGIRSNSSITVSLLRTSEFGQFDA